MVKQGIILNIEGANLCLKEVPSTPVHRQRKFNFDAPVATFPFFVQEQIIEYNLKILRPFLLKPGD